MNSSRQDFPPESSSSHRRLREYCHGQNHVKNQDQNQQQCRQHQTHGNNLIQSNTIQNQFSILSNQRDKFIHDRIQAEKELEQLQREQCHVKSEHDKFIDFNHRSKEGLGQKIEKLAMLKEEEIRLNKLIENEFHAIQNCTQRLNTLNKGKDEKTKRYIAEMDPLNSELSALLGRRVEKKIERCITVRSIEKVILPELDKALLEKNKPQFLNQRTILNQSIEFLKSASEQRTSCIGLLAKLEERGDEVGAKIALDTGENSDDNSKRQRKSDLFYGLFRCQG